MEQFYGMSVLIVDDEEDIRRIIESILSPLGVDILQAKHGLEALEILHYKKVDLLLTDIKMPVMDGISLLREATRRQHDCVKLVLTGFGEKEYVLESLKLHVFDFLEKPFAREVLLNRVSNGLRFRRQQEYLNMAIKEFVCSYCKIASKDDFDRMSPEQRAKTIEAGLGLLKIVDLKNKTAA